MNTVIDNFAQILDFAKNYNLPLTKKRNILREYLQSKALSLLYSQKHSNNIFFVGGTSLRLLHGLDRFSEDLDFDIPQSVSPHIQPLVSGIVEGLKRENIECSVYENVTEKRGYYELRFTNLLHQLDLSSNKDEKLVIKLDFESFWKGHTRAVTLFTRYGVLTNVVGIPLAQLLVQKIVTYLNRKQTMVRDIYDIVWLLSHEVDMDTSFMQANNLSDTILDQALEKFENEKAKLGTFKNQLRPFLLNEDSVEKLTFFPDLLKQALSQE